MTLGELQQVLSEEELAAFGIATETEAATTAGFSAAENNYFDDEAHRMS